MRLHPEGKYSASVHWPLLAAGLPLPALQVFKTFLLQNPPPTSILLKLTVDLWSCVCAHPSKPFQPLQVLERANVKRFAVEEGKPEGVLAKLPLLADSSDRRPHFCP